jgi:hypothetical protein
MLLGKQPADYDVVTSALPANVESLFKRTIPVGRKFGVMIVVLEGIQVQVATFRAEADYRDGRRPECVTFGDDVADVLRRDFTINGSYDPMREEIHDWVGGEGIFAIGGMHNRHPGGAFCRGPPPAAAGSAVCGATELSNRSGNLRRN